MGCLAGDFKHELLNRLRSTMAVNVLITAICCAKSVIVKLTVLYPDGADSVLP